MVAFSIYAFSNILRTLLDPDAQERNLKLLLKERIHSLIMESVRERLGNNILLQTIGADKEIKLEYRPKSWLSSDANYTFINHAESGWLSDINFDELRRIMKLLEAQARRLGFEIYEGGTATIGATSRISQTTQTQTEKVPVKKIYLLKRFRELLPQDSCSQVGNRCWQFPENLQPIVDS